MPIGELVMRVMPWAFALLLQACAVQAIDNPDAPDLLGDFRSRSVAIEQRVGDAAGGNSSVELGAQAEFLDAELNRAYRELMARLPEPAREALRDSQRAWLKHRDAEAAFATTLWTREEFGSSAPLSVGLHQAQLVRDRVELLLSALQALPAE
jgi:uncharacterized protein YecT (DUF1311 family)